MPSETIYHFSERTEKMLVITGPNGGVGKIHSGKAPR